MSGSFLLTATLRRRRMSICISVFTAAFSVNYATEFREYFEANTHVFILMSHLCLRLPGCVLLAGFPVLIVSAVFILCNFEKSNSIYCIMFRFFVVFGRKINRNPSARFPMTLCTYVYGCRISVRTLKEENCEYCQAHFS